MLRFHIIVNIFQPVEDTGKKFPDFSPSCKILRKMKGRRKQLRREIFTNECAKFRESIMNGVWKKREKLFIKARFFLTFESERFLVRFGRFGADSRRMFRDTSPSIVEERCNREGHCHCWLELKLDRTAITLIERPTRAWELRSSAVVKFVWLYPPIGPLHSCFSMINFTGDRSTARVSTILVKSNEKAHYSRKYQNVVPILSHLTYFYVYEDFSDQGKRFCYFRVVHRIDRGSMENNRKRVFSTKWDLSSRKIQFFFKFDIVQFYFVNFVTSILFKRSRILFLTSILHLWVLHRRSIFIQRIVSLLSISKTTIQYRRPRILIFIRTLIEHIADLSFQRSTTEIFQFAI